MQTLQQFAQSKDAIITNMARLQQQTGQAGQSFQQFNQSVTQANQTFQQTASALAQTNQAFNQTTSTLRQATQGAQTFGDTWRQVLQIAAGIGLATTLESLARAFVNFLSTSSQLAARMQDIQRSFVALEGSSRQASQTMAALFETAQRTGVSFQTLVEGYRRLEAGAKGTSLSQAELKRNFDDITAGARVMGLTSQQVSSALVAFEQILTKGRLSAEELVRQLGNAVPGGLEKTARALGITTGELRSMAEAGVIPGTVAFTAFASEMGRIGASGGPIEGATASFERLGNEVTAWKTSIGGLINETLVPLADILSTISKVARELAGINPPGGGAEGQQILPSWLRGLLNLRGLFVPGELNRGEQETVGAIPGQGGLPIAPSRFTEQIRAAAQGAQVDVGLLSQLVRVESRFRPEVVSRPAGAVGLGQLLPSTAQQLQPGITREQLLEPQRNLDLAARYLRQQLDAFKDTDDQIRLALAAYQSGPGTIRRLLTEAAARGLPQTFEGITNIPPSAGGLGPAGRAYPGQVLEGVTSATAAQSEQVSRITQQYVKSLGEANDQFDRLRARAEALAASSANYGGILNKDIAQQLQSIVDKYVQIQTYVAAFPDQARAFGAGIQLEIQERTREAAILQQALLSEQGRRDLLRDQVEQLEQLEVQQRAHLVTERQGQEEAERYRRAAAADLRQRRLEDQPRLAGLTIRQQIAEYEQRIVALQNQVSGLGAEIEAQRVQALRPRLEAELTRAETFLGRPTVDLATQAREQVRAQADAVRAGLAEIERATAQHPGLQAVQERLQNILRDFDTAVAAVAERQAERVTQHQARLTRQARDQVEQIQAQMGALTLTPLQRETAEIQRRFEGWNDQLTEIARTQEERLPQATAEERVQIEAVLTTLRQALGLRQQLEASAIREAQARPERAYLEDLEQRLERLRVPGGEGGRFGALLGLPTPLDIELQQRQRTRQGEPILQTDEGQRRARLLQQQIREQERLVAAAELFGEVGNAVGNAWTQALLGIAQGTQTVSEAFRAMAQSILQSLIQITSQEAFRALIRFGIGAILGAGTSAAGGAVGGGGGAGENLNIAGISGGEFGGSGLQAGGIVRTPSFHMLAETGPEAVIPLNRMQEVLRPAAAAGQGQSHVTVINVPSREAAEETAAQQRALGRQTVINFVLSDLSQGEASSINRTLRTLQR